jgi:hypothetical protein
MPLTYRDRGTSGTQLDIVGGSATVGKLWKAVLSSSSGGSVQWCWTWHAGPGTGPEQHGTASNMHDARTLIETQWDVWLLATDLIEKPGG